MSDRLIQAFTVKTVAEKSLDAGAPVQAGSRSREYRAHNNRWQQWFERICDLCGVTINGSGPADIQVHHPQLARRIFLEGSLGVGESYMDGWWDCEALDELAFRAINAGIEQKLQKRLRLAYDVFMARAFNYQKISRAFQVGKHHYDTGNDLFEIMLDPTLSYSCAYWKNAETLEQAQLDKLALICRKLELEKGMHLLDIGSGWGGLAKFAAQHYNVKVTGITVSEEQAKLAAERCKGLPIEFRLQDYRNVHGSFDRIVSVGMFEHVGQKNYATYMAKCHSLLNDGGLFLLHTIGTRHTHELVDPWIQKYIFPNGKLPSVKQIAAAWESHFVLEDLQNFGPDYDRTLMAWYGNFAARYPEVSHRYDARFYRMWSYYLKVCAASFRARENQLWQMVFSKPDRRERYDSPR